VASAEGLADIEAVVETSPTVADLVLVIASSAAVPLLVVVPTGFEAEETRVWAAGSVVADGELRLVVEAASCGEAGFSGMVGWAGWCNGAEAQLTSVRRLVVLVARPDRDVAGAAEEDVGEETSEALRERVRLPPWVLSTPSLVLLLALPLRLSLAGLVLGLALSLLCCGVSRDCRWWCV
jgi:hypothetical protein